MPNKALAVLCYGNEGHTNEGRRHVNPELVALRQTAMPPRKTSTNRFGHSSRSFTRNAAILCALVAAWRPGPVLGNAFGEYTRQQGQGQQGSSNNYSTIRFPTRDSSGWAAYGDANISYYTSQPSITLTQQVPGQNGQAFSTVPLSRTTTIAKGFLATFAYQAVSNYESEDHSPIGSQGLSLYLGPVQIFGSTPPVMYPALPSVFHQENGMAWKARR